MQVIWKHTVFQDGIWKVIFSNVEGEYELSGPYPVQAVGRILNIDFYFRAKGNEWEFETNDKQGWLFLSNDKRSFQSKGHFSNADTMPLQNAAEIISECSTDFLDQLE